MDTTAERLTQIGLSRAEAEVYVALLRNGPLTVREVADVTGSSRTRVYPILYSLEEHGFVDGGAGYGTRFAAIPPELSLPNLVARRREELFNEERVSETLVRDLGELVRLAAPVEEEAVQVLRSPRLIAERFARLQDEAESSIDVFIKAPFFAPAGNPAEEAVLARGVRCRGLYEEAVLKSEHVGPYLRQWSDLGENIRLYPGELPMKLALFDRRIVIMPLEQPGDRALITAVIRHPALGALIHVAFE
ncbi:MAG: helix-turn-helix domain-containing protein, partial [Candidatus Dormibacteraeota bacterium]|nr:helix-turn-helix domain-containing protein [Candidatus Dormibacteraeota bacterium]